MLIIIWVSLLTDEYFDCDECLEIVEKGFSEFVWETSASGDLFPRGAKHKIEAVKGCLRFADAFNEIFEECSDANFTVHCERLARKLRVNMPKSY